MDRLDATRGRRTIARPGTGERPVGPPDHSPGRNGIRPPPTGPQGPNGCTAPPVFDRIGYPPPPQGFALGYGTPGLQPGRVQGSAL